MLFRKATLTARSIESVDHIKPNLWVPAGISR